MTEVKLPSNRSFALMFVVVFGLLAGWRFLAGDPRAWLWLGAAAAFGLAGLLTPERLTPLNRLWMRFGELLNRIVSPLVLGLMYVVLIVPVGFVMKLAGRDSMQRKLDRQADSYWQLREASGTDPESFRDQY